MLSFGMMAQFSLALLALTLQLRSAYGCSEPWGRASAVDSLGGYGLPLTVSGTCNVLVLVARSAFLPRFLLRIALSRIRCVVAAMYG